MHAIRFRRLLCWLLVAVSMGVIWSLSAQPHSAYYTGKIFGSYNDLARKAAHLTEFGLLTLLVYQALRLSARRVHWTSTIFIAALASIGCAVTDEWHQSFVPGRTSCSADVLIDSAGVFLSVALVCCYQVTRGRRH